MNRDSHLPFLRGPLFAAALAAYLAGCASVSEQNARTPAPAKTTAQGEDKPVIPPYKGGAYLKGDGPGRDIPDNLDQVPDAQPRPEPLHRFANGPYKVMGKTYRPMPPDQSYKEKGLASWYGRKFHGKNTASGEPYDMYAMTAAHATLPIPSYARVTNLNNGQSVLVRVNDRGPFHEGRIIDLSYTAAHKLDVLKEVTPVEVELVRMEAAPDSFLAQAASEDASSVSSREDASAVETSGEAIYLQLGAYANPESAEAMLQRASAQLSRQFPGVMRLEVGQLRKVQAGPFMSSAAAERAASLIRETLGVQPMRVLGRAAEAAPAMAASGLYLQFAAFSNHVSAEVLGNRVKAHFGAELPGIDQLAEGNLIKVQAGPFADQAAAERVALAYQQDFGVKPYKVRR